MDLQLVTNNPRVVVLGQPDEDDIYEVQRLQTKTNITNSSKERSSRQNSKLPSHRGKLSSLQDRPASCNSEQIRQTCQLKEKRDVSIGSEIE